MKTINMPDIPLPSPEDWDYYKNYNCREYIEEILESLQKDNRFLVDFRFQKLLMWFSKEGNEYGATQKILNKGMVLYRARIYDKRADSNEKDESRFNGYGKLESFVPPESVYIKEGRANPSNVRYLYASRNCCTAIAEVNPPLKSDASVAEIMINKSLCILSFDSCSSSSTGPDDDEKRWKRNFIIEITRLFNTPSEKQGYILCQYISEFAKNLGYDGISFRSSKIKTDQDKNTDVNYVIFNFDKCEAVSSKLYYIFDRKIEVKVKTTSGYVKNAD